MLYLFETINSKFSAAQIMPVLTTVNSIYIAATLTLGILIFAKKSLRSNKVLRYALFYMASQLVYFILTGIAAKKDSPGMIAAVGYLGPSFMILQFRMTDAFNFKTPDYSFIYKLYATGIVLGSLFSIFDINYFNDELIYNSSFTSIMLPALLPFIGLTVMSVNRIIENNNWSYQFNFFIQFSLLMSATYFIFFRLDPSHTITGYLSVIATMLSSLLVMIAVVYSDILNKNVSSIYSNSVDNILSEDFIDRTRMAKTLVTDMIKGSDDIQKNNILGSLERYYDDLHAELSLARSEKDKIQKISNSYISEIKFTEIVNYLSSHGVRISPDVPQDFKIVCSRELLMNDVLDPIKKLGNEIFLESVRFDRKRLVTLIFRAPSDFNIFNESEFYSYNKLKSRHYLTLSSSILRQDRTPPTL